MLNPQELHVLPLTQAVVLPRMNATIPVDSEDAKRAVKAAVEGDGRFLLLPKVEGRYAEVGVIAKLEERGNLPDGTDVIVLQGRHRARLGLVSTAA
ncbi:MAG: LON peptidase substrate-binding domain-containing protein, partial [Candidatus Dormibacteraceae bacterium]